MSNPPELEPPLAHSPPAPAPPAAASRRRALLIAWVQVLLVASALFTVDWFVSEGREAGWERNTVRNALARIAKAPKARVAIMGSSTSKDWLPEALAGKVLGVPARSVLDAHLNGCHQDCTWAEVRRLKSEGRRFEAVFFGTNLFQLCEFEHTKRILQQSRLIPASDLPDLVWSLGAAVRPLRAWGRLLGIGLSGAYADGTVVRRALDVAMRRIWNPALPPEQAKRRRAAPGWSWARRKGLPTSNTLSCDYEPASIALKRGYSEGLLDDLHALTDRVFLVLLPDVTLGLDEAEHRARWVAHRALHAELAASRPWVTLVDLTEGGVRSAARYRDGFHLNAKGIAEQQALFEARMGPARTEAGWPTMAEAAR